jgi:hypothetical protein
MCQLTANCKSADAYVIVHKAAGKCAEYRRNACEKCARKIGRLTGTPLIDMPGRESTYYRLESLT